MSEKLCVFCKHCDINLGEMYVRTPGAVGSVCCYRKVQKELEPYMSMDEFRGWIVKADTCPHYERD
jgi:hypothetical protein